MNSIFQQSKIISSSYFINVVNQFRYYFTPSPADPELSCSYCRENSQVISLTSYALLTGSGSLNTSNTSSSHLTTKFSTTQPPYLHNLISIQCPRSTRSSSVVTLARPHSSSSKSDLQGHSKVLTTVPFHRPHMIS